MIKKEDILKRYKVRSLSAIKDSDIIEFAKFGELGPKTASSAVTGWVFNDEHELADKIREAIEREKQLAVYVEEDDFCTNTKIMVAFE